MKAYFATLFVVTILALIFAVPGLGLMAALFTFGLALILLIPLPFVLIGLWSVFPAVLFWEKPMMRWPLLIAGGILATLLFVLPPYFADLGVSAELKARNDVVPNSLNVAQPIGIEIHRGASPRSDFYVSGEKSTAFYSAKPCFELCERLLTGGDVAWVRIVLTDDAYGNDGAQTFALLIPGDPAQCASVNADFPSGTSCALYAPDHAQAADLTIILHEEQTSWGGDRFTPYQPIGYREAIAYDGPSAEAPVLFRGSQIFYERPTGMISYDLGSLGRADSGGGFELVRSRQASAPVDLVGAIDSMGLALGPPIILQPKTPGTEDNPFIAPPPDAQDAAYVASLIDAGPSQRPTQYSNAFGQVINDWHRRLRWKSSLSEADRTIFCATLKDERVANLFWADQVIRKHTIGCQ